MKSLPIFCFRWQSLIPATVAEQLTLHRAINNNLRVVVNTVFSLISCKPHYRIPMRAIHLNTSEAIYWKRLCSYMLTSNHSPHSRKFYFLLGNNHVACRPHCRRWRYPPFLQFPVMCIDIGASLFCFRSHNGRRITYHQSLHTLYAWSPSPRHGTAHVKTRKPYISHYTMEKQAASPCTWHGKIGFISFRVIFFWKRVSICMKRQPISRPAGSMADQVKLLYRDVVFSN